MPPAAVLPRDASRHGVAPWPAGIHPADVAPILGERWGLCKQAPGRNAIFARVGRAAAAGDGCPFHEGCDRRTVPADQASTPRNPQPAGRRWEGYRRGTYWAGRTARRGCRRGTAVFTASSTPGAGPAISPAIGINLPGGTS